MLIEAAVAIPLLLLVVLGIIDFGLLFQRYEVLTNAAREGARVAVLPVGYSGEEVQERVRQYVAAGGLNKTLATPTPPTETKPELSPGVCITVKTVTVTYPHTFSFVGGIVKFFGGTGFGATQLTATASMRSEGPATCP